MPTENDGTREQQHREVAEEVICLPEFLSRKDYTMQDIDRTDIVSNDETGAAGRRKRPDEDEKHKDGQTFDATPEDLLPVESFPVGLRGPAPDTEPPYFYEVSTAADGRTLTVGPFELTAEHIKSWSAGITPDELQALVDQRQLRAATVVAVRSTLFKTTIELLQSGQKPNREMIERFIPGDLQRVIASKILRK